MPRMPTPTVLPNWRSTWTSAEPTPLRDTGSESRARFSDIGSDDDFIKSVGSEITPGTSAIFLMIEASTPDRVLDEVRGRGDIRVLSTSLSKDAEERLREALGTPTREESLQKVS